VRLAAELDLRACYWQPPPRRVRQRMELYAEIRSRIEGRPVRPSTGQAVLRHTYLAPTMEAARREAEEGVLSAFVYNDPFRSRDVFTNPGEELRPGTKLDWEFLEPRTLLVGSPEHVAERVQELVEVCGLEYLLLGYAHPGVSQRETLRSLELFATRVMPAFRGTPGPGERPARGAAQHE
jgi:alkanesulfonate monooxygenase SsuD/methylene tetrahydromethanopterin reductase-like flavin-dependent oxidoreductase (luciferase family)